MVALLEKEDGIQCRACGATYAFPHYTKYGACNSCLHKYEYWIRGCGVSEEKKQDNLETFDLWLARFLLMQLKRLDKYGIVGSCEAMKQQGVRSGEKGYQCGNYARGMRDGRRLCHSHINSPNVAFVTNRYAMYDHLEAALRALDIKDARFAEIIRKIASEATEPTFKPDLPLPSNPNSTEATTVQDGARDE